MLKDHEYGKKNLIFSSKCINRKNKTSNGIFSSREKINKQKMVCQK